MVDRGKGERGWEREWICSCEVCELQLFFLFLLSIQND